MKYEFDWSLLSNWEFQGRVLAGLFLTLKISAISGFGALVVGTILLLIREAPIAPFARFSNGRIASWHPLRHLSIAFVEFFRNTPLLIQLVFWSVFGSWIRLPVQYTSGFVVGCFGLTIYTAAYISEDLRSGLRSVANHQIEASRATGLSYLQSYYYVILPQVFRVAIPPILSQMLNLLKNSTLVSFLAVPELLSVCRRMAVEGSTFESLFEATIVFVIISLIVSAATKFYQSLFLVR